MIYDYDAILGTLFVMFILSLFVERALALLFQWRYYQKYLSGKGLKPVISFLLAYAVVCKYDFDIISLVVNRGSFVWGLIISAGVIAGGSKGVMLIWGKIKEAWKLK